MAFPTLQIHICPCACVQHHHSRALMAEGSLFCCSCTPHMFTKGKARQHSSPASLRAKGALMDVRGFPCAPCMGRTNTSRPCANSEHLRCPETQSSWLDLQGVQERTQETELTFDDLLLSPTGVTVGEHGSKQSLWLLRDYNKYILSSL